MRAGTERAGLEGRGVGRAGARGPLLGAAALLLGALPGAQAGPNEPCTGIDDPAARLACYDRLHGRSPGAAAPDSTPIRPTPTTPVPAAEVPRAPGTQPSAAAPAPAPSEPAPSAADPTPAQPDGPGPAREPTDGGDRLHTIVAAGTLPTGRRWFRLDDGSLWEQLTMRRTALEVDDRVVLSRSLIGSWRLRPADGGRGTQVRPSG